jgi:hypothetical protein
VSVNGETADCGFIFTSIQHPHILYPPIRASLPFDGVAIVVSREMRNFILNKFSGFPKFESMFDLKKDGISKVLTFKM